MGQQEYVDLLKSSITTLAKKAVMLELSTAWPILLIAGSPVTIITTWVVGSILDIAFKESFLQIIFWYIDFRVSEQAGDFEKDALKYQSLLQSGDENALKAAEASLVNSFRTLAKFTPVVDPASK